MTKHAKQPRTRKPEAAEQAKQPGGTTIIQAMDDLFWRSFKGPSWDRGKQELAPPPRINKAALLSLGRKWS